MAGPTPPDPFETVWQRMMRQTGNAFGTAAQVLPITHMLRYAGDQAARLNAVADPQAASRARQTQATAAPALAFGPAPQAQPAAAPAPRAPGNASFGSIFDALIQQESGGRAGVLGPQTNYGRAEGLTQMLPSTARGVARQNGIPWRPELMRSNSNEGAAYQRQLGELYFKEALEKTGNVRDALHYYHGGPDRDLWGPKTRAYAEQVLGRVGGGAPAGAAGPTFTMMNPAAAASFIPDPKLLQRVDLPDAPQMAMPAARPQLEQMDRTAALAPLAEAMKVAPRDTAGDPWDRVQAMLAQAALAAAQNPNVPLGSMIAAAGGAGLQGFRAERENQRELTREEQEQLRQTRIALAEAGFKIDAGNLDTRNQNANINWQSGEDTRNTAFQNETLTFENALRQLGFNMDIDRANVGAINDVAQLRGRVGLETLQGNQELQNQSILQGYQTQTGRENMALEAGLRQQLAGGGATGAGALLSGLGLPTDASKDPLIANAQAAAGYIAANNPAAAITSLANELVLSGRFKDALSDDTAKKVEQAIQQENVALAGQLASAELQTNHALAIQWAEELAKTGLPTATLITRNRRPN